MVHYGETNISYNDSVSNYGLYKDYKNTGDFLIDEQESSSETDYIDEQESSSETDFQPETTIQHEKEVKLEKKPVLERKENLRVSKDGFDILPFITGASLAYLAHDKFITKKYSWAYVFAGFTIGYLGGNYISKIVNKK